MRGGVDEFADLPGQVEDGLNGHPVGVGAVHRQGEPQRQSPGAPGEVVGEVGRIPVLRMVGLVQRIQVRRVLGVHRGRLVGIAVQHRGAVERREPPFVRVGDEGIGVLEAGETPVLIRQQRRGAVGAIDMHPQIAFSAHRRDALKVIDDARIGRARGGHHSDDGRAVITVQGGPQPRPGETVVLGRHHEGFHVEDPTGVGDRRMRLVTAGDPHLTNPEPFPPDLPGDGQGGEVRGRSAGYEGATRIGRHAGQIGDPAQHLVLRDDRTGGLQPRAPLQ